jgi:hypothetical protein
MLRIHIEYARNRKDGFTVREEMFLKYKIAQNIMAEAEEDPKFAEQVESEEAFMEEVQIRFFDLEEMKAEADRLEGGWFKKLIYRISPA